MKLGRFSTQKISSFFFKNESGILFCQLQPSPIQYNLKIIFWLSLTEVVRMELLKTQIFNENSTTNIDELQALSMGRF